MAKCSSSATLPCMVPPSFLEAGFLEAGAGAFVIYEAAPDHVNMLLAACAHFDTSLLRGSDKLSRRVAAVPIFPAISSIVVMETVAPPIKRSLQCSRRP